MSMPADSFGSHSSDANETRDYQRRFISSEGLSGACVPGTNRSFAFEPGFRTGIYYDEVSDKDLDELEAAVPAEALAAVFLRCLENLDDIVDIVIESAHETEVARWQSSEPFPSELFLAEQVEKTVLLEMLANNKPWLICDGMSAIAVYGSDVAGVSDPTEIMLRDDKVIHVYAENSRLFLEIFDMYGVPSNPNVAFVSDGAHVHFTSEKLKAKTRELIAYLGAVPFIRDED